MNESLLRQKCKNNAGMNLQPRMKSLISKLWRGMKKAVSANTTILLYLRINLTVGSLAVSKPPRIVP